MESQNRNHNEVSTIRYMFKQSLFSYVYQQVKCRLTFATPPACALKRIDIQSSFLHMTVFCKLSVTEPS